MPKLIKNIPDMKKPISKLNLKKKRRYNLATRLEHRRVKGKQK